MKTIKIAFALSLSLVMAGCAQFDAAVNYLASPRFTTATTNLKNVAMAFDCGVVVPLSSLSQQIATLVNAGESAIGTTGKVYALSVLICNTISALPDSTVVAAPTALPAGTKVKAVSVVPAS